MRRLPLRVHASIIWGILVGCILVAGGPGIARGAELGADLREAQENLAAFDKGLTFHERKLLRQTSVRDEGRLSGRLRKKFHRREEIKKIVERLRLMSDLKQRLLDLPGREQYASDSLRGLHQKEAEDIARTAVPAFEELKRSYEMVRPAIFHNLLVNIRLKDQGFCWHWARDLTDRLRELGLQTFDLLWATARGGTMREHNTVVLVSHGHNLQEGLLLDGWRKAGKPFWMMVKDDKNHPWKLGEYYGGK